MIVTLFGGPKLLCKMLPARDLDVDLEFTFEQTNLILNASKNAGGNNVAIFAMGIETFKILGRCQAGSVLSHGEKVPL